MQHLKTRTTIGLSLAFILGFLLLFNSASADTPRQDVPPNVIKVGYVGSVDSPMARGIQLAITQVNEAGGITAADGVDYIYELVVAEITQPEQVPAAIESLTGEGVVAIFGPDTNALTLPNIETMTNASVPIITAATDDALFTEDTNANIFRAVAPERIYSAALASYLIEYREFTSVALIRQGEAWSNTFVGLRFALNQDQGINPSLTIEGETLEDVSARLPEIVSLNPDAVVLYGDAATAIAVLNDLRSNNWTGIFVYRTPTDPFMGQVTQGVISVDTWTFGASDPLSATFVAQYVAEFGASPMPLSVAGYDTFFALNRVIRLQGLDAATVRAGLTNFDGLDLVRGTVGDFDERNLNMSAYVYQLNGRGGHRQLAIFDNGVLREGSLDTEGITAVLTTPTPTPTLAPSATPSVITGTVDNPVLNVRTGPSTAYDSIDQLQDGDQVIIVGHNGDYSWYLVQYDGQTGWVSADFIDVFDPANLLPSLPVIPAPPTPTPSADDNGDGGGDGDGTSTALPAEADLVITGVTISPAVPRPGCAFTATVAITNQGGSNAGGFAVATTFIPADAATFAGANSGGVASTASTTVALNQTINYTAYVPNLAYVVDLNSEVAEGDGENNNEFVQNFKVDKPLSVETEVTLTANSTLDFFGGVPDVLWDGTTFTMQATGQIGAFTGGETYESSHYDQVPGTADETTYANPLPDAVLAFITVEGDYGVLEILSVSNGTVNFAYRVYNSTADCQ